METKIETDKQTYMQTFHFERDTQREVRIDTKRLGTKGGELEYCITVQHKKTKRERGGEREREADRQTKKQRGKERRETGT